MGAERLGILRIDLFAGTAPFIQKLREAELSVKAFGVGLNTNFNKELASAQRIINATVKSVFNLKTGLAAAAAALGAYGALRGLDAAAETVDKLGKASKRLGLSVEELSALRFAAGEAGVEFESLASMVSRASKSVAELVAKGNAETKLGRLTVQLKDANGQVRSIAALLPEIARGIMSAGSAAEQLRLSQKIFGRGGGDQFITLLKDGGGNFLSMMTEQSERARRLNVIFTEDQVRRLTAYRDAVGRVQEAWLGVRVAIINQVAPVLTKLLDDAALRLAEMPALVTAAIRAAHQMLAGGRQSQVALEALSQLRTSVIGVMAAAGVSIGRVIGTAFIETAKIGLVSLAPVLEDVFRDALAPLVNVIPGVEIDKSERSKLAALQARLREAAALREQIQIGFQPIVRSGGVFRGGMFRDDVDTGPLRDTRPTGDLLRKQDQLIALLGRQIKMQEMAVAARDAAVTQTIVEASAAGYQATSLAVERSREQLQAAVADFDAARQKLMDAFGGGEMGPPAPDAATPPPVVLTFREWLSDLGDRAMATGEAIGKNLGQGWEKGWKDLQEKLRAQQDYADSIMKDAQQIRFEIYPQEKADAEIERLRFVQAEVRRLGLQIQLTDAEVDKRIAQILEESRKAAEKQGESLAGKMKKSVEDFSVSAAGAIADLVVDGKASFDELAKSWSKTLISMAAEEAFLRPLFKGIGAQVFGGGTPVPVSSAFGNVFEGGRIQAFADGGIVSRRTLLPAALMGEAGPEAVMPLQRIGGKLGVRAAGGGTIVQIIDQRSSGARPQVSERTGPDGRKMLTITIRDEVGRMIGDGSFDRVMGLSYGSGRRPISR